MNPHLAYQQQKSLGVARIDLLLMLYDGVIERLEQASKSLVRGDRATATPLLLRSQRIVAELIAGLDYQYGQMPRDMCRLYCYVLQAIGQATPTPSDVNAAVQVLQILRQGFVGVRAEAVQLERSGSIATSDRVHSVVATA